MADIRPQPGTIVPGGERQKEVSAAGVVGCLGKLAENPRHGSEAEEACDKASPRDAVMLHLRSCYVSKAAILTVPVSLVPVENRSPA
jgi:hypothetical protein